MRATRYSLIAVFGIVLLLPSKEVVTAPAPPQSPPTYQQFLSPASPLEVVAAKKVDRIAWVGFEEGKRNAYTAVAPAFTPVRLTNFTKDDGIDHVGHPISRTTDRQSCSCAERRRTGAAGSPTRPPIRTGPSAPSGRRAPQAVRRGRSSSRRANPELAPDGSSVLFVKDGQIHRAKVTPVEAGDGDGSRREAVHQGMGRRRARRSGRPTARRSRSSAPAPITASSSSTTWPTRTVKYMSPSVDFDTSPMWTSDSKTIVFVRRPGLPFGQQAQQGTGGARAAERAGVSAARRQGARQAAAAAARGRGKLRARGDRRRAPRCTGQPQGRPAPDPGVASARACTRATFKGGYTLSIWKADVATGEAQEVWHNQPNDRVVTQLHQLASGGRLRRVPARSSAADAAAAARAAQRPTRTQPAAPTGPGRRVGSLLLAEHREPGRTPGAADDDRRLDRGSDVGRDLADGKTFYYCTNAKRHRAPSHLGGAGRRRHAAAGDDGRRDRDVPGAAAVGQDAGDAQRRLEDAAVGRHLAARARRRRRAEDHLSDARARTSRSTRTSSRSS